MDPIGLTTIPAEASDGVPLMTKAGGPDVKPTIFFLNGLGGSWHAWRYQLEHFGRTHRVIAWDYRGTYLSPAPPQGRLDVRRHAEDALAVLDATTSGEPVHIIGWSLGVQVALELYHLAPERFAKLVLIGGVAGKIFDTLPAAPLTRRVMPLAVRFAQRRHLLTTGIVARAARAPELLVWAKTLGIVAEELEPDLWAEIAEGFANLNMRHYLQILEEVGKHDAWHVLPNIEVPTLVITGDRDRFTPRSAAERMVRTIPNAEFMPVSGGTHYVAAEFPNLINLRVEKFLAESS